MASFLVAYGTGEGQTAKVADRIVATLGDRGHDATAVDITEGAEDVAASEYDAVLVGASVRVGKHQGAVVDFVTENREALSVRPTAFFQVSLASASDRGVEQAAEYVESFLSKTGWNPDRIAQFGGALRFSEYGFLTRLAMKLIAKRRLPGVDTTRDTEFTDWNAVEDFADDVAAFVEGRHGIDAPNVDASEGG